MPNADAPRITRSRSRSRLTPVILSSLSALFVRVHRFPVHVHVHVRVHVVLASVLFL